ncbi:MAG TPA: mobile mystery protein B [Rhizomicrobium sp.]|nr:mobile mystery protein B [Rhizomicrobium sp.]
MSGPFEEAPGATPLSAEEREGLIPSHITLRHELNEFEQQNIIEAATWAFTRRHNPVAEPFARGLHRRMFDQTWKWAGVYRRSGKNVGGDWALIHARLAEELDNFRYWIANKTFPADEIAVRFHHVLVLIHPFPNGNGRWSRLMADVLLARLDQPRLTWGGSALVDADEVRARYMAALRAADAHDLAPLLDFARS